MTSPAEELLWRPVCTRVCELCWGCVSSIWFLARQSDGRWASHSLYTLTDWWWHSECIQRQSVSIAAVSYGTEEIFLLLSAFLCERCDQYVSDNVWLRIPRKKKKLFYSALLIAHNLLHADDYLRYDEDLNMSWWTYFTVWLTHTYYTYCIRCIVIVDYFTSAIISSKLFPSSCWFMPINWDQWANICSSDQSQPAV